MTTEHQPPTPILDVQDLSIAYTHGRESVTAVDSVSFALAPGDRLAIIGESGSGKSSIVNSLLGLLPENSRRSATSVRFDDVDLSALSSETDWNQVRGRRIAFIPQDPTIALDPVMRIGPQVVETLTLHGGLERRAARGRTLELLDQVGIRDPERVFRAHPHELSGGMRQRVLIAIALAGDAELIIADEPTSGLDVTVQGVVLDLLDEVVRSHGVSVVLITHDLAVAGARADQILVLQDGRIIESGRTAEILAAPRSAYTRRMLEAAPSIHHTKLAASAEARERAVTAAPGDSDRGQSLLELRGVVKEYSRKGLGQGSFRAVDEVSLTVPAGSSLGIVGESGSGKSTLARIATGIVRPDQGQVLYRGEDVTHRRGAVKRRLFSQMQYVFQNPYSSLDPRFSVAEVIAEPLDALQATSRSERDRRVAEVLDAVGLPADIARRSPTELSGGQRQRVAIARAVALRPPLLVLDEPVSALDVTVQAQILQLLADLQSEFSLTYLFITHDLAVVRLLCDDALVLENGRVVEHRPVADLFADPAKDYTRALLAAIP